MKNLCNTAAIPRRDSLVAVRDEPESPGQRICALEARIVIVPYRYDICLNLTTTKCDLSASVPQL